ncbi:hypothetical protein PHOSAC3_150359 [Mesotoga infera]|nr:hypothetical protein PHOSAC3_150359 [Mesotoga infera]
MSGSRGKYRKAGAIPYNRLRSFSAYGRIDTEELPNTFFK